MNRSELLNSLAEDKGIRPTALIRDLVYEKLDEILPSHQYELAKAKDGAHWRESVSNRIKGRKKQD
tara:strand:- start:1291 stop:1488 length:198 start_codon:yes stop_codon:yes gene_type:complete